MPTPSPPKGRGPVEPYRPLGPLPPRTVRAVARLGSRPVADGHLADAAALAAPSYELAAYGPHAGGLQALAHARAPTSTDRIGARIKMRNFRRTRTPLATSGRFRRANLPETPQHACISPGQRSQQRTAPAENRTEVQDPWRNRRPFPAKPTRSRGGATASKAAATVTPARAQPEASRGTPAGEAAAADEHAGMLIGSICAYSQTNACTGCTANHRTKALMENGEPPVRTRLAHLAQRAPLADVHARCRAALYAPGPHVAPGGVAVGRHRKPPDRKRLRQSSGNESKSQPEASRKRYRQRLLSHKQICRHRLSREEERF